MSNVSHFHSPQKRSYLELPIKFILQTSAKLADLGLTILNGISEALEKSSFEIFFLISDF